MARCHRSEVIRREKCTCGGIRVYMLTGGNLHCCGFIEPTVRAYCAGCRWRSVTRFMPLGPWNGGGDEDQETPEEAAPSHGAVG